MKRLLLSTLLSASVSVAFATETGYRTIANYGCHVHDSTCFVEIDGDAVGGELGCESRDLRWDHNSASGQEVYAAIMAADAQGKQFMANVSGCYSATPAYPTFNYYRVR